MRAGSEYALEPLREGAELSLYRGRDCGNQTPILAVAVAAERPSAQSLRRLEYEYSLAAVLDGAWAAQPLALTRHQGRTMLLLKDPGGELLDRLIAQHNGQWADVGGFLRVAIGLAAALGHAHRHGLIHKDVKPENVLVGEAGRVWLTGFGIASRLPRERQVPASPEVIAGTLAYMSPEQTGRMNRSLDTRSDLYSLGVTLYQMLTGALPFTATDPLEWVHCHIARQPVAPVDRCAVPEPLSAIIMKLLAKNSEERYQTAAGLESDLQRCLIEWESRSRIAAFPLGTHDSSDRLLIPEKLYGREREVGKLLAAFERVATSGASELVLVSGYPGVGKSSVVNELHKVLAPLRGLFAAGKFDQYKRDVPYATLAEAFQTLVRQILVRSEAEVDRWRQALLQALGPNGQLIINLIPEIEFIIGKQPPVAELPPQEARQHFQLVFRRFLGAFAQPAHPLVLFLDDLQWLDTATVELLQRLATDAEMRHVLLIGAFRENEVNSSHPLSRTLSAIRAAGARTQEILLSPLDLAEVSRLIADSLHCSRDRAAALALLVHEKTGGNPFFAIHFLTSLVEGGLLRFERPSASWAWDLGQIRARGFSDNVADLMVEKLRRLPATTQAALQQLACLGNVAELATLNVVFERSEDETNKALLEAIRGGLILRVENSYTFLHDRIQEAAYALIPLERRAALHLQIGRILVARVAPGKLEESIFEIVNQLNRAAALVTAPDEREQLAEFNLLAGKRAQASSAYISALNYLTSGSALLDEDSWERCRQLCFGLELARAHCEFASGAIAEAEGRLRGLSVRASMTTERVAVACLQVDLYQGIDRGDEAVAVGLRVLRHLGITLPEHPTETDARRAYHVTSARLVGRSHDDLLNLPRMSDPISLAALDLLIRVAVAGHFSDSFYLFAVAVCTAVNLGLERGHSDASCIAYAQLATLAGAYFGQFDTGFRFGRLGCELVEQAGMQRFRARTLETFGFVVPWTQHVRKGREFLLRSFDLASQSGEISYAGYACGQLNTNYLMAGDPLIEAQAQAEHGLAFARKVGFKAIEAWILGQLGLIRCLRGLTVRFGCFDDAVFLERDLERDLAGKPVLALPECWYYIRKLQARFLAGDYPEAMQSASRAQPMLSNIATLLEIVEYHFYAALCHAALHDAASPEDRHQHRARLVEHREKLTTWAAHCPENFANRAALAGAELARIEGREPDAEQLYERAISSARAADLIQNEGLANELAGRFYVARGLEAAGYAYLRNARGCYVRWGADGKVTHLDERYPRLRQGRTAAATAMAEPASQLDVETVVKASQVLSGEIVLPRLIEKLVRLALEHAGAERGLLILIRDGEPRIEAEATTGRGGVEVLVRQESITPADLPQSMLLYVIRTQELVLLDDASAEAVYSTDEYVRRKRLKSVVCLPIVKQTKLMGALYLENNLAPFVFTPERVSVLQLLASQAAISLENATLYTDLQLQVGLLEHLPVSAWTLKPDGTPDFVNQIWLDFAGHTLDFVRSRPDAWMAAVHPEDRELAAKAFWEGVHAGQGFAMETRTLRARDGVYRWHLNQAVVLRDAAGRVLKFVGTTTDIDVQKHAEEALRQAQSDLARINRITTMGELTASLAHEISQPITGVITNGNLFLRKLGRDKPDLDEVREAVMRVVRDGQRAAEILARIRSKFQKGALDRGILDVNEISRETVALLRHEAARYAILVRLELAADLPKIVGDRVQLQQVVMNLIVNSIEAMKDVEGIREMTVRSQRTENEQILVSVSDTGIGLPPQSEEQIFAPFFTTKPHGTGMGLRISRSIVESHGGRLWAVGSQGRGATFHLTLPSASSGSTAGDLNPS